MYIFIFLMPFYFDWKSSKKKKKTFSKIFIDFEIMSVV